MIAVASEFRDWDIALMIFLLSIAMFVPNLVEGIRSYKIGRDLARQLHKERDKPRLFDQDRDVSQ